MKDAIGIRGTIPQAFVFSRYDAGIPDEYRGNGYGRRFR
jgi:hypothetical protein